MTICGYSFDQDVRSLPQVSEVGPSLYACFRKTFPEERLYEAPNIEFAERSWDVLIGTRGTAIYKITFQYLTQEPLEAAFVFVTAEKALNSEFGTGLECPPNGARIWKVPTGEIVLEAGRAEHELRFVDLFATRREWDGLYYCECLECKQPLRVPAGRGDIMIKCPRCSFKFIRQT